jgi:hypothetical protein
VAQGNGLAGRQQSGRGSVSAGKLPEHLVKRPILLNDKNDVLNLGTTTGGGLRLLRLFLGAREGHKTEQTKRVKHCYPTDFTHVTPNLKQSCQGCRAGGAAYDIVIPQFE